MSEKPLTLHSNGQQIVGMLHAPVYTRAPLVIMCHGLTMNKLGTPWRLFVQAARFLCSRGFAVLRFDFRGSGDSEGDFEAQTITSQLADLEAVLNISERLSSRIGIIGHSNGGAVALLAAVRDSRINCIIGWGAVSNFAILGCSARDFGGFRITDELLRDCRSYDLLEAARKLRKPFLIIHGSADEAVPVSHALNLYESLKGQKKLRLIPECGHLFTTHRDLLFSLTADWLDKWLR
jgi:pimeloyl-ACP methyl ester carboxylesterase